MLPCSGSVRGVHWPFKKKKKKQAYDTHVRSSFGSSNTTKCSLLHILTVLIIHMRYNNNVVVEYSKMYAHFCC